MTQQTKSTLADLDAQTLFHAVSSIDDVETNGPTIFKAARGAEITDIDDRTYVDMGAGLWCVNVGYGRDEIADAASEAIRSLSFQHLFGGASCESTIRLASRLLLLFNGTVPGADMARVFFGNSGSDANDTAVKLVRYYNNLLGRPAKKKIISRVGAYHGVTVAAGSLTGIASYHASFDLPVDGVFHASCPHHYRFSRPGEDEQAFAERLAGELEAMILREGPDTVAGFIAEPVMGTGGVLLPPATYFDRVQAILERYDVLLIVDEVITGFGRTGHWFGSGAFGLRPDIVSLAKGLTSAYFPTSASLVSRRIWDVFSSTSKAIGAFMHGFTYSGHPVGSAVAMANLDIVERENLVSNAASLERVLVGSLQDAIGSFPFVGDIRGIGLMAAVEFVANRETKAEFAPGAAPHRVAARHAMQNGTLVRALPFIPVNSFSPPLSITEPEIREGVRRYALGLLCARGEIEAMVS